MSVHDTADNDPGQRADALPLEDQWRDTNEGWEALARFMGYLNAGHPCHDGTCRYCGEHPCHGGATS